jgi:hypothetical protein
MMHLTRQPKARPRLRESFRQTVVVAAVAALLGLGLLASGEYVIAQHRSAAAAVASNDDEIYTGSILYMPYEGRICRQILFDNLTGQLSDNGSVDCDRAAYHGTYSTPKQWSFARVRVISTGFRDR